MLFDAVDGDDDDDDNDDMMPSRREPLNVPLHLSLTTGSVRAIMTTKGSSSCSWWLLSQNIAATRNRSSRVGNL